MPIFCHVCLENAQFFFCHFCLEKCHFCSFFAIFAWKMPIVDHFWPFWPRECPSLTVFCHVCLEKDHQGCGTGWCRVIQGCGTGWCRHTRVRIPAQSYQADGRQRRYKKRPCWAECDQPVLAGFRDLRSSVVHLSQRQKLPKCNILRGWLY